VSGSIKVCHLPARTRLDAPWAVRKVCARKWRLGAHAKHAGTAQLPDGRRVEGKMLELLLLVRPRAYSHMKLRPACLARRVCRCGWRAPAQCTAWRTCRRRPCSRSPPRACCPRGEGRRCLSRLSIALHVLLLNAGTTMPSRVRPRRPARTSIHANHTVLAHVMWRAQPRVCVCAQAAAARGAGRRPARVRCLRGRRRPGCGCGQGGGGGGGGFNSCCQCS
jgi:hypothetical protein